MSASLPRLGNSSTLLRSPASRPGSSASGARIGLASARVAQLDSRDSVGGATNAASNAARLASREHSAVLRQLGTSLSLQEIEQQRERKEVPSPWVAKYQDVAKRELMHVDIAPLLDRFESVSLYHKPQRKPLSVALQEMAALPQSRAETAGGASVSASQPPAMRAAALTKQKTLKCQVTKVTRQRRSASEQSTVSGSSSSRMAVLDDGASTDTGAGSPAARSSRIVPTRFLYDRTRWQQSARCDYCSFAGGDLECATCNVIAHARCYLRAYAATSKKTKGAFVVPTRFSWLCCACQQSLQDEYDERAKHARMQHITMQRHIFGKVVTAYVRMTKDALVFQAKKRAIVQIQAAFRGRLARLRFERMMRMVLKPYAIDGIRVRGLTSEPSSSSGGSSGGGGSGAMASPSTDDLRLANGLTCNPYVYVSVVDGKDDENQLFCFETSVRKGVAPAEPDVSWRDKLFVPGIDGNVTLVFTLLSKNGPNHFFLGQAVLRLRDSDSIWRAGIAAADLPLADDVKIFPKTTQRQLLRLVEVSGGQKVQSFGTGAGAGVGNGSRARRRDTSSSTLFANSSSAALTLSVHVQPCSDVHSHCGYLGMKPTLESVQTSSRWCVLADDGVLRIYRHFGVTLASDIVDMARTIDVRLVEARRGAGSSSSVRERGQQLCIVIQHVSRLFVLQAEHRAGNKLWLKKLQAATKFGAAAVAVGGSSSGGGGTSASGSGHDTAVESCGSSV